MFVDKLEEEDKDGDGKHSRSNSMIISDINISRKSHTVQLPSLIKNSMEDGQAVDTIKKEALEESSSSHPMKDGHDKFMLLALNMSVQKCFELYYADDAPHFWGVFYESKGDQKIDNAKWEDPQGDDECNYPGKNS